MQTSRVLVVTLITLVTSNSAIDQSSPSLDRGHPSPDTQRDGVKRGSGIEDTSAFVGFLFNYSIPHNAFIGDISQYEVTEAGEGSLPSWLHFDPSSRSFKGVPQPPDVGLVYICVKAVGKKPALGGLRSVAKDVFSIDVVAETPASFTCLEKESVTLGTVFVDLTISQLQPLELVKILDSVASSIELPSSSLRLTAVVQRDNPFENSILFAGKGDSLKQSQHGARIQFRIGCSAEDATKDNSLVRYLRENSAGGELSDIIGFPVIGWEVTGDHPPRNKRHVTPYMPTPVPGVRITHRPKHTQRVEETESSEDSVPEQRIVPTMVSPFYFQPTNHHNHHRHRHGEDPLRRESFPKPAVVSPTLHYHPFPSGRNIYGTPLPTPVPYPGRPTTFVVQPSQEFVEDTIDRLRPSIAIITEDVRSRWFIPTTDYLTVDLKPTGSRITVEPTKQIPQAPNFKPTVSNRMKKLSLVAGKAWSYAIPRDTFIDLEDGNTRDLKLMFMTSQRASIPPNSWIQFDPENQMMYALPFNDNAGTYEFVLEAMDSEGASTFERVELHVWPHPSYELFNHEFIMTVRYNKWQYPVGIDWQIEVLNRISRLFEHSDNSLISVKTVTLDPVKIVWVNDSLPVDRCPFEEIKRIYDTISTSDRQPTKEMKKFMLPEFRIQDIGVKFNGSCKGVVTSPAPPPNFPPRLRNPINRINATVGDVIKYKIPDETFYDFEDGSTRHLRLTLLTREKLQLPKSSWLQFDSRNQELYGIAMESDVGEHYYQLNAIDSDGYPVPDNFVVQVHPLSFRKKPPVEFSIHVDEDFEKFIADASRQTLLAGKIARLYGDMTPQYLMIINITKGSVVYSWSNKTLPKDFCPKDRIDKLVKYLVNEDGSLSVNLIQVMEPEFRVTSADAIPKGVCLGGPSGVPPTFVTITTTTPHPDVSEVPIEPTTKTATDEDIYITTIVPAVVIAVMLLIAAIVAYFLYRKKRKGKMGLGDKDFIGSGVPVVFAGELEEQKPDLGKAPAIMKNEKPPLSADHILGSLPFRRGTAAVRDSTPQTAAKTGRERSERSSRERKETAALYQPPPPFTSSRENKSTRPKSTATYRQPTYVPP